MIKLLIIESDKELAQESCSGLKEYFSEKKAAISFVCSGKEGLETIKSDPPTVILLNYFLSDISGDELFLKIKTEYPSVAIIILTNEGSAELAHKFLDIGADDYVTRKYGYNGIGTEIEKVVLKKEQELEAALSKVSLGKMKKVLEIGQILSTKTHLDDLLRTIIKESSNIIKAEKASIFLYDSKTSELWIKTSEDIETGGVRFSINKGIAGHVARTGELIVINDAYSHELFNPDVDIKTGFKTRNIICAPMKNLQGNLVGVFQVLNKSDGVFTGEDKEILTMISSFASILIENSILAEENVQQERMAMVGNMASTIIHDIRNPIGTIQGFAEIIAESPEHKEYADIIVSSTERLLNMIQELLEFSRGTVNDIKFEKVKCSDFFMEFQAGITRDFEEKNIKLSLFRNYKGKIEINPDKMLRCLYNIAGNARDAMEDGGEFIIDVSEHGSEQDMLITMSDTGKGMPDEIKNTLFEPFVTYGKSNGTGLGMAITKKIIDAHKGTIKVESELGKGTRFELKLPKYQNL